MRLLVATWGIVCLLVAAACAQPAAPSNLGVSGSPAGPPVSIVFLEAGTAATYGIEFWDSTTGSVTSDSGVVHTGPRSLKLSGGVATATRRAWAFPTVAGRVSFYYQLAAVPTDNNNNVIDLQSFFTTPEFSLSIRDTGILRAYTNNMGTQLGSDGPTLATGQWYLIVIAFTITSTTVNEWRVWVDGTLAITGANATLSRDDIEDIRLLERTHTAYYSDIYADDSSSLTDPGDIRVTAKLPASVNTGNFDTTGGTGAVNERALSETNYMQHAATTDVQQNYTLQTAAVGDVDISTGVTLVGRSAWIWAKGAAGGAGTPKIMDNGSESAVVLTSAAKLFTVLTTSASYPSNAAGIGMRSTNDADDTLLYECGTLIAYTPAAGAAGNPYYAYQQQ